VQGNPFEHALTIYFLLTKVWRTMETAVDEGKVRQLGISNFYRLEDVMYAYDQARIKPKVVQNRFYAQSGHDVEIREFCRQHDIEYQSFWTLTGNPDAFNHQAAQELAKNKKLSPEAVRNLYCCYYEFSYIAQTVQNT
jgi:diketogulonate reductase-like aldo/keto reductase